MFRELTLENFRAFQNLHLTGLGRVNLLVGANNSGKTSVLEAIAFLATDGDPTMLFATLSRRGETTSFDPENQSLAVDVRHLFFGRKLDDSGSLRLGAVRSSGEPVEFRLSTPRVPDEALSAWREAVKIGRRSRRGPGRGEAPVIDLDRSERIPRFLTIAVPGVPPVNVPLLLNHGLTAFNAATPIEQNRPMVLLPTAGVADDELAGRFDKIAATAEEDRVVAALQEIEPGITRLRTVQVGSLGTDRGFIVAMEGTSEPVPLGSLGDGVHRLLAIALSLVTARGGYVLVDEIDTGLHHTVMRKMWKLIFETAKRLDVTVFATTHSYDCVHALSAIAPPPDRACGEVSLIRVERGNPVGVHFSEEEIRRLAEWQLDDARQCDARHDGDLSSRVAGR